MTTDPTFEFDIVPEDAAAHFALDAWDAVKYQLMELQPAKKVQLLGTLPNRVRVLSFGERCEVAPGLLAAIGDRLGVAVRVEQRGE